MDPIAFGFGGPGDVAIVAFLILVLFGGAKLPQLMKGMGEGIREFKKAATEETSDSKPAEAAKSQEK